MILLAAILLLWLLLAIALAVIIGQACAISHPEDPVCLDEPGAWTRLDDHL